MKLPTNIAGITSEGVHYWHGNSQVIADIPSYGLSYFSSYDSLIDHLYLRGYKVSAKEINKRLKDLV